MFRANFCPHRTRSATLPRSEPLPTTTTGYYTIFCKYFQSCAPEDGQKFAPKHVHLILEINKIVIVGSSWFYILLYFIYPIYNHNWRNISTVCIYITRLASNEIFSPSNKIHRKVGRAKYLSAPLYVPY